MAMTDGKVSENILKRSVLKQIKQVNKDVATGAVFGEDCAILNLKEKTGAATASGFGVEGGRIAMIKASNNLSAGGFSASFFQISIILPKETEEEELKKLMKVLAKEASVLDGEIVGGQTEVSRSVNEISVTVTAIGNLFSDCCPNKKNIKPGDSIIASKWVGLEGIGTLVPEKRDVLTDRFGEEFVSRTDKYTEWLSVKEEAVIAAKNGVVAMKDVSENGIFGCLWELGSVAGLGLKADLLLIPIRQEAIEICNYFNINPYELKSSGMLLMVTDEPETLIEKLADKGIPAVKIGEFTDNNDRIIVNDDEERHLDKIKQDEIYKII